MVLYPIKGCVLKKDSFDLELCHSMIENLQKQDEMKNNDYQLCASIALLHLMQKSLHNIKESESSLYPSKELLF